MDRLEWIRRSGPLPVEETLQLPGHPEVFVLGDAALLVNGDGQPLPMLSTVALQEAETAAANISRLAQGKALKKFRYKDPGLLATIGRGCRGTHLGLSFRDSLPGRSGWDCTSTG
jgi:NADH dehydrogenase